MTTRGRPGIDVTIRSFRPSDVTRLSMIFCDSIRDAGPRHYSPEQVAAWSALGDDLPAFKEWLNIATTWVADDGFAGCVGFAGLQSPDRIASLFVAPESMGQGVGAALVRHLLSELDRQGVSSATTEASEFSRPLFERCGFRVTLKEQTRVRGVEFSRYVMQLGGVTV